MSSLPRTIRGTIAGTDNTGVSRDLSPAVHVTPEDHYIVKTRRDFGRESQESQRVEVVNGSRRKRGFFSFVGRR